MNDATQRVIREAAHGRLHFGQVVDLLMQAGVESYVADYRTQRTTYYPTDGDTFSLDLPMPDVDIAQDFDDAAVQAAIRGAQQGGVMYPEFKKLSRQAGCIGYTVWIAGRHVSYYGRKGEIHVERFPD
jgi:uncharacterized protein YbcV (DUF1398 family)